MAITKVIQPISMPWMESVIHRMMARMSHARVRFSRADMGPCSFCLASISTRLMATAWEGLNSTRTRTIVIREATMAGTPMYLTQPIQLPTASPA